jgi:D-alanyl-D-alanine carboxypeptidase
VAVLLIGSMLFAFTHLGTHSKQSTLPHPTPVATPTVQDMHGISTFLMDATSGKVLVDVKSHVRRPIASMTAIMTAVIAIEDADLNQYVTVDQATLDAVPEGTGMAGLHAGDRLQLHELLYGLLLSSGNDAALVVAQAVAGSPQRFVSMMNDEAHQLQLNDTHFNVPYSILSLSNYSSAADLTRLGAYALQLFPFVQIVKEKEHTLVATEQNRGYYWHTTNMLLAAYQGMNGIMVSSDAQAGACMVFSARKNDRTLVGAELHAQSYKELGSDITKLLKQGFSS